MMKCSDMRHDGNNCKARKHRRGPSSYHMHDSNIVFQNMGLKSGETFLDLGCGAGDYSMHAAELVGDLGKVYALDLQEKSMGEFIRKAEKKELKNIYPIVSDFREYLPIADSSVDMCLIATVLHAIEFSTEDKWISEISRVLKPDGKLAILECKKEKSEFGPPIQMRISPDEVEEKLAPHGFFKSNFVDLGMNYLIVFSMKM